ncbi:GcrA family cell cycle regulator [Pseudochelatococcus lubricantis]|uniref:GcrA family cell cycle regulator n=1 Tax=Pseudochelatococcus lubricantis TaxID=1538102 RepID=UPI0035ED0015
MSDPGNTWTDERVEQLRKLWSDGLSASQIATEIGGVSRNAVIGKVHRLGLSGRAKAPAAQTPRPPRKAPAPAAPVVSAPRQAPSVAAPAPVPQPLASTFGNAALATAALAAEPDDMPAATLATDIVPVVRENVVVPMSERVTIMDLREYMCRWPVGDPTSPNFRFCGARAVTGMPYCTHHASIAYQPVLDRRRDRKRA